MFTLGRQLHFHYIEASLKTMEKILTMTLAGSQHVQVHTIWSCGLMHFALPLMLFILVGRIIPSTQLL